MRMLALDFINVGNGDSILVREMEPICNCSQSTNSHGNKFLRKFMDFLSNKVDGYKLLFGFSSIVFIISVNNNSSVKV